MTSPSAHKLPLAWLHPIARNVAIVMGFNTLIALGLSIAHGGDGLVQFVYSQSIGISIWVLIEVERRWFKGNPVTHWPRGWRMPVMIVASVLPGYTFGTWLGDQYCGCSSFGQWPGAADSFVSYLVLTVALSAGITYFMFTRGRDRDRLRVLALAQRDTAEARLQLLASQLEPHMLFNTLANLRVLIELDPPRAQAMLDQLISFLRSTLDASRGGTDHSLASEFERLRDYLGLMQVRMGDRLQSRLDLPPALAGCRVSPLLLQPLVENAIKHGLEPHVEGGRLDVSAAREGDELVLRVRDTGAGLAADLSPGGTHFGLQLVRDRLKASHGGAASLSLEPAPDADGGTLATIRLPMETSS